MGRDKRNYFCWRRSNKRIPSYFCRSQIIECDVTSQLALFWVQRKETHQKHCKNDEIANFTAGLMIWANYNIGCSMEAYSKGSYKFFDEQMPCGTGVSSSFLPDHQLFSHDCYCSPATCQLCCFLEEVSTDINRHMNRSMPRREYFWRQQGQKNIFCRNKSESDEKLL